MNLGGKKTKIVLAAAVLVASCVALKLGQLAWGLHHHRAAQAALERRDFRQAEVHLRSCLGVWPFDPPLRLLAARAARRSGNLSKAQSDLIAYKKLRGAENKWQLEQRLILLHRAELSEADKLLEECTADPASPDAYLILEAIIMATLHRLEEALRNGSNVLDGKAAGFRLLTERAVTHWLTWHQARSDQVQGLIWRGRLHLLTTNHEEAIADFGKALELDPEWHDARLLLALTLYERDPMSALVHLEFLWQRERSDERVCFALAGCRRSLGRLKEAERLLDEFLSDNPRHAGILLERGKITLDRGQPEEAEPFLRRAVAEAPDNSAIRLTLSRCLLLTGKEQEAQEHQRRYYAISAEETRLQESRLTEKRTQANRPQPKGDK
jgi:tetratricopeptide (TPR) repeat protein